jgi:hypothetical protein
MLFQDFFSGFLEESLETPIAFGEFIHSNQKKKSNFPCNRYSLVGCGFRINKFAGEKGLQLAALCFITSFLEVMKTKKKYPVNPV